MERVGAGLKQENRVPADSRKWFKEHFCWSLAFDSFFSWLYFKEDEMS